MLHYKKFLVLILPFLILNGIKIFANPDVIWQKDVQTPAEVRFAPDDQYVAYQNWKYIYLVDTETSKTYFEFFPVENFAFIGNNQIIVQHKDTMRIIDYSEKRVLDTILLPIKCKGLDFNDSINKLLLWSNLMSSISNAGKQQKYFEYDFSTNEIGEVKNLDAIVTKDSIFYEYDYTVEIQFMRYTYDNNFLISLHFIINDSGKPGYETIYDHTYLFNPEENKYFVKNNVRLQNTCQTALSENREFVASENFDDNNISLDIYSVKDSLKIAKSFQGDNGNYLLVNISHDNNYLLQAIDSGLKIWDLEDTEKPVHTYEIYNPTYNYGIIDISHNNKYIAIFNEHLLVLIKGYFYPSSVGEDESDIKIQIIPNPVQNTIKISAFFDNPYNIKIRINDVTGNEIYQEEIGIVAGDFNHSIDAGIFPVGTYFLQLQTHNNVISEKFVIER